MTALGDEPAGEPAVPCTEARRLRPERVFPSYRYTPGQNPHPVQDPAGHSWGHAHETAPGDFEYGLDLYHHEYFWEAHEVWEGLWRLEPAGPGRDLLQGLIQHAAALLKRRVRSRRGERQLSVKAIGYLERAAAAARGARVLGLDVDETLAAVRACHADAESRPPLFFPRAD